MREKLKKISNYCLNLFFPLNCAGCGKDLINEKGICRECLGKIKYVKEPYCYKCGSNKEVGFLCNKCRNIKYYFQRIYICSLYEGILRKCIHSFKYKEKTILQQPLGNLLVTYISKKIDLEEIDCLVPVPLFKSQKKRRGFNQVNLLTKKIEKHFAKPQIINNLIRIRKTVPQFDLNRKQRRENVKDAFEVKNPQLFKGRRILLVDDVCTTGATLNECARVLDQCQVEKIFCLALAHG
ncbi:ComF family protein [bacterium]|nr:ComF family protein [bacterium]